MANEFAPPAVNFPTFFQNHVIPSAYGHPIAVPAYYDATTDSFYWQTPNLDPPGNDAFSRLRVSSPGYRFDSQFTYRINSDLWDTNASSGSTIVLDSVNRWVTLTTGIGTGSVAQIQSHYHSPYTPGRSQLCYVTGQFGTTPPSGAVRRMGYRCITESNGVYLEQTSTGVNFVLDGGTSLGTQRVSQSNWNIDTFDGNGNSRITLDLTKIQILAIDLQALYSGRVRCGFDVNDILYWVHQFVHANVVNYPYIQQAGLPVSWEAIGGSGSVTMHAICSTVISDGGRDLFDIPGVTYGIGTGITSVAVTTRRPLLTIRVKKTFNNITYNGVIFPEEVETMCQSNDAYIEVVRNATLAAATGSLIWADVDTVRSATEYNTNATTIASGSVIAVTYANAGQGSSRLQSSQNLLGKIVMSYSHLLNAQDTLTIVATSFSGTSNVSCSIDWKEIR